MGISVVEAGIIHVEAFGDGGVYQWQPIHKEDTGETTLLRLCW